MQAIDKQQYDKSQFRPSHSVFVAANAGSGKTSLLTRRVLSLLMHGVEPSKILCLTFTNGAAAEMTDRVVRTLGSWVMMEEAELEKTLGEFMPKPVHPEMLARARRLFAQVLDHPVGLRLQTIHGFCQSLLARFPLEAGVGLHLKVMDETTQAALLKEARMQLFARAGEEERQQLYSLVQQLGEHNLLGMLGECLKHKRKLRRFIDSHHGTALAEKHLLKEFGVADAQAAPSYAMDEDSLAMLRGIVAKLAQSSKSTDAERMGGMSCFLAEGDFGAYAACFLTKDGSPAKNLHTKDAVTSEQSEFLRAEQARVIDFIERLQNWQDAHFTAGLLSIAARLLDYYEALKEQHGLMDFDDQILAATRLLTQNRVSAWVMYKLDGGIDHVLVDEAQDTSPEQWQIVRAITAEFFAGQGRKTVERSLFVVGDEKQSIFRFQGADPAGFDINRRHFMTLLNDAAMPFIQLDLIRSYRSAPEILQLVDRVFAQETVRKGLSASGAAPSHEANRHDAKGYVELWPVTHGDEERSADFILARKLASQIRDWVVAGASPGDVMVLVPTRKRLPSLLSRALKRLHIPVAGVDRMELLDNLAVMDLLAFAQVMLLPEDDLTLAALLKSPLFNFSEEVVFELCHGRKASVWEALAAHPECKETYQLLAEFRGKADFVSPYALFAELLDARGFRRAFTGRMGEETHEVLDMFLEQALQYEEENTVSLQGFIAWMQSGTGEIKRDMEHAAAQVRIMTVHASKGLQAKIVVLAGTAALRGTRDQMQWSGDVPLASAGDAGSVIRRAKDRECELEMEEYRRLLYVALTRAEDMLLVCGSAFRSKTGYQEGSWYPMVKDAMEQLGTTHEDGRITFGNMPAFMRTEQIAASHFSPVLYGQAPSEQEPPRPLSPSKLGYEMPAAASPTLNPLLIERGVAIHRLLQYLPNITAGREEAAMALASSYAPSLDEAERQALVAEALSIIESSAFAPLFGADSMAEVPVCGTVLWKGQPVRVVGQVDRLVVLEQEVWLVDYKSSARPPEPSRMPAAYRQQMELYRTVLQEIYPGKRIRAGLLWTATGRMDLLDAGPNETYILSIT